MSSSLFKPQDVRCSRRRRKSRPSGIAPRTAYQLLSAILPPALIGEVARRLRQRLPSLDATFLPAPPAETIKIDAKPIPMLRLLRGPSFGYGYSSERTVNGRMGVARLSFRYGPVEIEASEKQMEVEAFHEGAHPRREPQPQRREKGVQAPCGSRLRCRPRPRSSRPWRSTASSVTSTIPSGSRCRRRSA